MFSTISLTSSRGVWIILSERTFEMSGEKLYIAFLHFQVMYYCRANCFFDLLASGRHALSLSLSQHYCDFLRDCQRDFCPFYDLI